MRPENAAGDGEPHGRPRRTQRRSPTIEDVAAIAGVSRGTVSRALNGGHYVSSASLAAVNRAILETGYVVNRNARNLVTQRAGSVAFVLSEPQEKLFEDPNFSVLLRASTQALAERDLQLVMMNAARSDERDRVLRYVRGGHVDGVLLISTHGGDPIMNELERSAVPVVACGKPLGHESAIPYVAASSDPPLTTIRQPLERAAGEMVRLLLDLIDGKDVGPVVLPTELVTRDSA